MKKLLVTSALPYANGPIHIGHLVEYIQTDIWVRYWKLRGRDTAYMCADDTHGTPIMIRARDEGVPPEELIDRVHAEHRRDFERFQIRFDNYYTTHSEENRRLSGEVYGALKDRGHIARRMIEQSYCASCEMFLPDRFIRGTCPACGAEEQYGDSCEVCATSYSPKDLLDARCAVCGDEPESRQSEHLFFQLGDFTSALRTWVREGDSAQAEATALHVQPEIANKLDEWFEAGLADWDISRDEPYFGFKIPGEVGKYFYVWLDAPIGYMAATMNWCERTGRDFDSYWRTDEAADVCHIIGKDITYFHTLFWPAMLMGSGFRTPTNVFVHGFLTVDRQKMSKSRGTFIMAETFADHIDPQHLRYYYATKLTGRVEDIDLSLEDFVQRVNADLVNKIANLASRAWVILNRHCEGWLRPMDDTGKRMVADLQGRIDSIAHHYEAREFGRVTREVAEMAGLANAYFNEREPWTLAKNNANAAASICTAGVNAYRIIATMLAPVLPEFAERSARMLGVEELRWDDLQVPMEDGQLQPFERLAERITNDAVDALLEASRQREPEHEEVEVPVLSLDPLLDIEIRPMRVDRCAPVERGRGLLSLDLFDGEEQRVVVAGLGHTNPKRFDGEALWVVANMPPKRIGGVESRGMLLGWDSDLGPSPVNVAR